MSDYALHTHNPSVKIFDFARVRCKMQRTLSFCKKPCKNCRLRAGD